MNSKDCSVIIYWFYALWPVLNNVNLHMRSISPFSEQLPLNGKNLFVRYTIKAVLFSILFPKQLTYTCIILSILFLLLFNLK